MSTNTELSDDERTAGRQLALVLDLLSRSRPMPLREIDRVYYGDVSAGTARKRRGRAKEALADCGVYIAQGRTNGSLGWSVDPSCMASGALDERESQLVRALGATLITDSGYLPWRPYLRAALAKVCGAPSSWRLTPLPPATRGEDDADPHVASALATCLARHVAAEFDYVDARGVRSHRIVDPLGFFDLRGHSYLASVLADVVAAGEVRTFRCDRIAHVGVTQIPQRPHPDVDVASFRKLPFQMGDAVASCTFDVSHLTRGRLAQLTSGHGELEQNENERLWTVEAASLPDAAAWAVAMGVDPLAPRELVEEWRGVLSLSRHGFKGTLPAHAAISRGSGRNGSGRVLRMLLAMAADLTRAGHQVLATDVSRRFGVTVQEARRLLSVLLAAAGGSAEHDALLSLGLSDDGNAVAALDDASCRLRPLRLTPLEAAALEGALNKVGMPPDDPIRTRLKDAFWPQEGLLEAPNGPADAVACYPTLASCVVAGLAGRALSFWYQGQRDHAPRERHVAEPRVWQDGERWMLDARDLDATPGDDERTFVVADIADLALLDHPSPRQDARGQDSKARREVELRFGDPHLLDLLEWPGLELDETRVLPLVGHITYTGGTWLVRRVAAGGGTVTTPDEELAHAVRSYAEALLA